MTYVLKEVEDATNSESCSHKYSSTIKYKRTDLCQLFPVCLCHCSHKWDSHWHSLFLRRKAIISKHVVESPTIFTPRSWIAAFFLHFTGDYLQHLGCAYLLRICLKGWTKMFVECLHIKGNHGRNKKLIKLDS